jgi:hypothetical protein
MSRLVWIVAVGLICASSGCALIPDVMHEPQFHNPFPQLHRVAVLPFGNQSKEPTVDGEQVAIAYYNELQAIRGFEVMPVGVAKRLVAASEFTPSSPADFQKLAQVLGVDAVVVGSVTEYSPYYPPRMGLAVNWYAANPSFHPIPAGYGLPWGTPHECDIPEEFLFEAELALAREQLQTQSPALLPAESEKLAPAVFQPEEVVAPPASDRNSANDSNAAAMSPDSEAGNGIAPPLLPAEWPDPRGFIPPAPGLARPAARPQSQPVMTHTRIYHGGNADFTARLEKYYYFRDDARFGGWQSYLQRTDDFTRFCCHLHITEMLAARGGAGKPRVVYRWPISRYER